MGDRIDEYGMVHSCELDDDDRIECTWCGGEGVDECDDPIQCMDPSCNGSFCTCRCCEGRGYDQVIW